MLFASRRAPSIPSASSAWATAGTRAPVSPSSATKRRKTEGTVNAIQKASELAPAPRTAAITMSRTAPRTRERPVPRIDVRTARRKV